MVKKILIVDDQAVVRLGLEILLKESFNPLILSLAPDFFSALYYVKKREYDLVILDINMPGGRNSKMIDSLREIQPDIKILVYTALEDRIYATHYMQAGADGFVSKTDGEKYWNCNLLLEEFARQYLFPSSWGIFHSPDPLEPIFN